MRRPGLIVGVLAVAVIGYISYNSLRTEGQGSRGVDPGRELPAFAVPLAMSGLEGDANVSDRACDVRGPDVLNVCELADRGPLVLSFFAEPVERCDAQVDLIDRLRPRYPGVQFAAVAIRGDRDEVRERVRRQRWELPVGHDADGAVANLYAVAVCPQTTFALQGGEVLETTFGSMDEAALVEAIEALE